MKDLTKGNTFKVLFQMAVPLVLSGLLSKGYNIIDTIIVGKFLGEKSLGAIGAVSPLITSLCSLTWGYSAGFGSIMGTLFGKKDYVNLKKSYYSNLIFVIGACLLITLPVAFSAKNVVSLFKVSGEISSEAVIYLSVYLGGTVLIILNNFFLHVFNAIGSSAFPLIMSLVSAALNITGNILSVTVLNLGIAGIALSSVLAATVADICYFIKIKGYFKTLNVDKLKTGLDFSHVFSGIKVTAFCSFQQFVLYFASLLLSPMVNMLGAEASASYTVSLKVYDIVSIVFFNSSRTLTAFVSQCIGAKKTYKIIKGLSITISQAFIFLLPLLLACVIFPKTICMMFFKAGYSGKGLVYSVNFLRYYMPFMVFLVLNNQWHSLFRGYKKMNALIIASFSGTASWLIFGYILLHVYGMYGFYAGWTASWIIDALIGAVFAYRLVVLRR